MGEEGGERGEKREGEEMGGGGSFTSRSVIHDCKETSNFAKINEVRQEA